MGKESDFKRFIEMLKEATSRIEPEYFLLPVAGKEDAVYRERVYCYELYHRLREVFKEAGFQYSLVGEVDKSGHTIIYPKIGAKKPDLIVHIPRKMDKNLVVIEIKPIKAQTEDIKKDLKTLAYFLTEANYFRAIHLVYGGTKDDLERHIKRSFEKKRLRFSNYLYVIWHEAPQSKAKICNWAGLVGDNSDD